MNFYVCVFRQLAHTIWLLPLSFPLAVTLVMNKAVVSAHGERERGTEYLAG